MKLSFFSAVFCLFSLSSVAQTSNPQPLKPNITVRRVMTAQSLIVRLEKNPSNGKLYYMDYFGNVFELRDIETAGAKDTLIYTAANHGVTSPQGLAFHDSTIFVSGNINNDSVTVGIIKRGVLQGNGTTLWSTVAETEPYPLSGALDHLFSGMTLDPDGDSILLCSGSRGDHGEVHDNKGQFPGLRNLPITSIIMRIPTQTYTFIKNDSAWLNTSGLIYARGIRNTYDMAFDGKNNLFGLENSGERDHNDEMNWLRPGNHYGFPYEIGDTKNPQQFPGYDPDKDPLLNPLSTGYRAGFFHNDPNFPTQPAVTFQQPIQNIGPDADKFRDSITGMVKDASDMGITMGTFTSHRTPLGLVFDNDSLLHNDYIGDAFMLSWNKGYMDSCGCRTTPDTAIGPYMDLSEDLIHLNLTYDVSVGNYKLSATRIVGGFSNPVDNVIDSNKIYVVEFGFGTTGLYEVTLPPNNVSIREVKDPLQKLHCYPNPAAGNITFEIPENCKGGVLNIYNYLGQTVRSLNTNTESKLKLSTEEFGNGIYFYELLSPAVHFAGKILIQK